MIVQDKHNRISQLQCSSVLANTLRFLSRTTGHWLRACRHLSWTIIFIRSPLVACSLLRSFCNRSQVIVTGYKNYYAGSYANLTQSPWWLKLLTPNHLNRNRPQAGRAKTRKREDWWKPSMCKTAQHNESRFKRLAGLRQRAKSRYCRNSGFLSAWMCASVLACTCHTSWSIRNFNRQYHQSAYQDQNQ